jgi:hypothetical protein
MKSKGKILLLLGVAALVIAAGKEPAPPPSPGSDVEPPEPVEPGESTGPDIIDNNPIDNITLTLPDSAIRPKDGSTVQQITYVK